MSWSEPVGPKVLAAALLRLLLPCALASAILATGVLGQGRPVTGTGSQGITFGAVFPGVNGIVLPSDATRAGRFDIRGQKNLQVRFDFTLPTAMTSGALSMPLVFGPTDGLYALTATVGSATAFDPRVPLLARLSANGRLYFWLGGTVTPSSAQAAGAYAATVTVTMAYTGL